MTDLEKHWDDVPVGPVPADAILRDARRQAAADLRRRPEARLQRSLKTVAVAGGIAAAFVVGTLVPDGLGGSGEPGGVNDATPVAFHGELQAAKSCDALLKHYVDNSVDLVSSDGWMSAVRVIDTASGGWNGLERASASDTTAYSTSPTKLSAQSGAAARGSFGGTVRAKPSDTGTNVQEVGVDEPDSVKTDGEVLVRLRDAVLTTYDVSAEDEPTEPTQPAEPTDEPTTATPSAFPTDEPTETTSASASPSADATGEPPSDASSESTATTGSSPTVDASSTPTSEPTSDPTSAPTSEPTTEPTADPEPEPTTPTDLTELGRLDLGDLHDAEILLAGDTVVAIGTDGSRFSPDSVQGRTLGTGAGAPAPQTRVVTVDLSDPAAPKLEQTVDYDATLVAARQHGTDVRLVLTKGLPDLPFKNDAEANRALVEGTTLDDWLPHVSVDGGKAKDLLACDRIAVPRADLAPATMAVVGFSATEPGTTDSLGLAGDAPLTYESADHLYLAASAAPVVPGCFRCGGFGDVDQTPVPDAASGQSDGTSHIYDFALDGTGATYVGAGEVEGAIRDRWSMDEYDGVLRVAVNASSETKDATSIVTFRPDGDRLNEVGRVDGIGENEDMKAVRWFDGLALVVTYFRVTFTDPLFAVDLTDPTNPTVTGELKIPGFSDYLHPLGTKRVLGMGSDGRNRAQAGFFDVTDLTDPRQLDTVTYARGTVAKAGADPRQFTWVPEKRTALTVIERNGTGYVSELAISGGQMANTMTEVEYGRDVDAVRLVPVGGGRVVLVTGEDVAYFDVE